MICYVIAYDGKEFSNGGNYSEFHVNVAAPSITLRC